MASSDNDAYFRKMEKMIGDPDPFVRARVIDNYGVHGMMSDDVRTQVVENLSDQDINVKAASIQTILSLEGNSGSAAAQEALRFLDHDNQQLRVAAR